jgi:hypothetical protein
MLGAEQFVSTRNQHKAVLAFAFNEMPYPKHSSLEAHQLGEALNPVQPSNRLTHWLTVEKLVERHPNTQNRKHGLHATPRKCYGDSRLADAAVQKLSNGQSVRKALERLLQASHSHSTGGYSRRYGATAKPSYCESL